METASYPDRGNNLIYPSLKLNGEAGEVAEKIGKLWRNTGEWPNPKEMDEAKKLEIIKEMGDVLWYLAALADEFEIELDHVAQTNIAKLRDRRERNVIKSEGDNR